MVQLTELFRRLEVKSLLVSHIDPLDLCVHFWTKGDLDSECPYSLELLYKCIAAEIENFNEGDYDTDEEFFEMLTLNGKYEIASLTMLDIPIYVLCKDGEYREFPSLIMTVRNKLWL